MILGKAPHRRTAAVNRARSQARYAALLAVGLLAMPLVQANPVRAESLLEAIAAAYQTNPQLDAERSRLRATDEEVPRAKSGYRPTIEGSASIGATHTRSEPVTTSDGRHRPTSWEVSVRQPLFTGFRTSNAISEAEANVRAGRQNLRRIETVVLLDAVRAYMDVIRDTRVLELRERNVRVLTRELEAARARQAVKEVTLTDVAQAQARRARAVSAADLAKSNLRISRATYLRVVGHPPRNLREPGLNIKGLPPTLERAVEIAHRESPNVVSALYREQASRFAVDRIRGELLPRVDLEASYSKQTGLSSFIDDREDASITGRLTVPFYRGGEVHSRVRQAKHTHVSRLQEIEQARNESRELVTQAWSRLVAARAQLRSDEVAVDSARLALEGVREEERVGQRTILDVLNAEQEYLEAQVARVATRRDLVVAGYALLANIGRVSAEELQAVDMVYEPEANYASVRNKWAGTAVTHREPPPPVPSLMRRTRNEAQTYEADGYEADGYVALDPDTPIERFATRRRPVSVAAGPARETLDLRDTSQPVDLMPEDQIHASEPAPPLRGTARVEDLYFEDTYAPPVELRENLHPEKLFERILRNTFE